MKRILSSRRRTATKHHPAFDLHKLEPWSAGHALTRAHDDDVGPLHAHAQARRIHDDVRVCVAGTRLPQDAHARDAHHRGNDCEYVAASRAYARARADP